MCSAYNTQQLIYVRITTEDIAFILLVVYVWYLVVHMYGKVYTYAYYVHMGIGKH